MSLFQHLHDQWKTLHSLGPPFILSSWPAASPAALFPPAPHSTHAHTLHRYTHPEQYPYFFFPICAEAKLSLLLLCASGSAPAHSAFVIFLTDLFLANPNLFFRIHNSGHLLLETFLRAPVWIRWSAGLYHSCLCLPLGEYIPHWSILGCCFCWIPHSAVSL